MAYKPILFNTEMVQAILDGRKTCTRRVIKADFHRVYKAACANGKWNETFCDEIPDKICKWYAKEVAKPPFHPSDILWVRETWRITDPWGDHELGNRRAHLEYKAGGYKEIPLYDDAELGKRWRPSIHMSKEAARLFLRVTDVRVERLQNITEGEAIAEGCDGDPFSVGNIANPIDNFANLWNSTIPKKDLDLYGWDASPWVWVFEFERCEKPEGWCK